MCCSPVALARRPRSTASHLLLTSSSLPWHTVPAWAPQTTRCPRVLVPRYPVDAVNGPRPTEYRLQDRRRVELKNDLLRLILDRHPPSLPSRIFFSTPSPSPPNTHTSSNAESGGDVQARAIRGPAEQVPGRVRLPDVPPDEGDEGVCGDRCVAGLLSLSIRRLLILHAPRPIWPTHTPGAPNDRAADEPCTYLCGNSLGLLPKRARKLVEEELDVWSTRCALL